MRAAVVRRRGAGWLALLPVLLLGAAGAGAAAAQERLVVLTESGTPVVAVEVLLATGPADEPEGQEGISYLAARSVVTPLLPMLDSLGARLDVSAQKDALSFTLIASPDAWEEATRSLLVALFRDPPHAAVVTREQGVVRAELVGRSSNPADALIRELDAAHFGEDHPWGRSTVGSVASIGALRASQVAEYLRDFFTSSRAVVAVVGPVDEAAAREHLRNYMALTGPLPFEPRAPRPAETAVRRDYNSITTWIGVSYGFAADADVEALRYLAQLATDELAFSPTRESVFNARAEVLHRLSGGELRFQLVAPPEEADRWAERITEVVAGVADRSLQEEVFRARLRRYRGERLHALSAPEDRAREMARRLMVTGRAGALLPELEALTAERLRAAVRALGRPTTVFLGPI